MKKSLLILMILLLCGCGGRVGNWNAEDTARQILDQGSYDTGFVLLDEDQIEGLLPGIMECCSEVVVYESDSEIMNEIIVARVTDAVGAEKVIEERKDYLLKESENYFPEQKEMIEEALLQIDQDRLVFVISADPSLILELLKSH